MEHGEVLKARPAKPGDALKIRLPEPGSTPKLVPLNSISPSKLASEKRTSPWKLAPSNLALTRVARWRSSVGRTARRKSASCSTGAPSSLRGTAASRSARRSSVNCTPVTASTAAPMASWAKIVSRLSLVVCAKHRLSPSTCRPRQPSILQAGQSSSMISAIINGRLTDRRARTERIRGSQRPGLPSVRGACQRFARAHSMVVLVPPRSFLSHATCELGNTVRHGVVGGGVDWPRWVRIAEVRGSNPLSSTRQTEPQVATASAQRPRCSYAVVACSGW
jgi:hypothetical protein